MTGTHGWSWAGGPPRPSPCRLPWALPPVSDLGFLAVTWRWLCLLCESVSHTDGPGRYGRAPVPRYAWQGLGGSRGPPDPEGGTGLQPVGSRLAANRWPQKERRT